MIRKGKADAGVLELGCVTAKADDAHDAGVLGLECASARQLMLMMLGFRGRNV